MKDKFFKIVGGFSLTMASIAILIAVIAGLTALVQFNKSADEEIQQPNIRLVQIYSSLEKKKGSESEESEPDSYDDSDYGVDEAYENRQKMMSLVESTVASLNAFAKITKQGSVNQVALVRYLEGNTPGLEGQDYITFLEGLDKAAKELNDKSKDIAALKSDDVKYINWGADFLPWFVESYVEEYNKEQQRVQDEIVEAHVSQASSLVTVAVAAGAFVFFVFFTLILLMVQIERNTRRT